MPTTPQTFLVEHYWPGITPERFEAAAEQVRRCATLLADDGAGIRFLHSTLVLKDESAFCVFAADSRTLVEEVYACAGVAYERVLDAYEVAIDREDP